MSRIGSFLIVVLWGINLVGCSLFPSRAPDLLVAHDFGPMRTHTIVRSEGFVLVRVKSPSWLDRTSIHYRLLYQDPTALHIYADNRWIAPPTALLEARIRAHLGSGPTQGAHTNQRRDRLTVVLSRFDQNFSAPDKAFVHVAMEGRLYSVTTGRLLATKIINLRRPCAPDAQGAVEGLSALARTASVAFAQFTRQYEDETPKD